MTIPKIIHHIAPVDQSKWHPIWQRCYPSWKKHFPDFEYKMWTDEHDIDGLVKEHFPEYWPIYQQFPLHIMKIDFARFCILYKYGGIYTDMDIFCYQNFYDELNNDVHLLPAPYGKQSTNGDNLIENALMISPAGHEFFRRCMDESIRVFTSQIRKIDIKFPLNTFQQLLVCNLAGPVLVSNVYSQFNSGVKILDPVTYNNHGLSYDHSFKTKHLLTGIWGKESIDLKSNDDYLREVSQYVNMGGITLDTFDFYKDYTNGRYLKN